MTSKKAQNEDKKLIKTNSIIKAATELFIENNNELPTVNQIADRSNIAKGTVYLYFKSKEHIFLSIHQLLWIDCVARFERFSKTNRLLKGEGLNVQPIVSFWFEYPHFSRLVTIKAAQIMPTLSVEEINEVVRSESLVLQEKSKQMHGLMKESTQALGHWVDLLDLSIKMIHLVWLKESMYDTIIPDKNSFSAKVERLLNPIWHQHVKELERASFKHKPWRHFMPSTN